MFSGSTLAITGPFESVVGSNYGDKLTTASSGTTLFGGLGDDSLSVAGGVDVTVFGGLGDDTIAVLGGDSVTVFGDDGADTIVVGGAATDVTVFGGLGDDSLGVVVGVDITVFGNEGNDTLVVIGGTDVTVFGNDGNDTYRFGAAGAESIKVKEILILDVTNFEGPDAGATAAAKGGDAESRGTDTLGLSAFTAAAFNLSVFGSEADALVVSAGFTLTIFGTFENVVGTAGNDTLVGNSSAKVIDGGGGNDSINGQGGDDTITGGAGNDTLTGGAGSDTYIFAGAGLGADRVVEAAGLDSDTLDFARYDAPLTLDLAVITTQSLGAVGQSLTLTDAAGVENVVGTVYADALRGNARDNALYGGGGADLLDGRAGNDNLQADFTQVVLLDFDSATNEASGDHAYTVEERAAIIARLQTVFGPFNYVFTTDPVQAAGLTAFTGRGYVTLVFNDGAGGGIGGEANELDFGNRVHGNRGAVDVNTLLGGADQPAATSENFVGLTVTIAAHELGHMAGLLHIDALGPVGTGIYAGLDPARFRPVFTGSAGAAETPRHIMASPLSLGTTLFDAAGPTYFGEREAVKLAFNEGGVVRVEQTTAAGSHETFATAEARGVLPGLYVPNTLIPGDRDYGKTFDVSAVSVVGTIQLTGGRSENDVYSFTGRAGDLMNFQVLSGVLTPSRGNPIDGLLKIYGSNGQLLATNDDSLESTDPAILDFVLPADGVYYVVVDTYAATLEEGGTLTRTGSFTDSGADTWTATVDYGTGAGPQSLTLNPDRTFALSHAYANNGAYTVTVVVNDGFVPSSPASFVVTVSDVAPTATLSNSGPVNEGGTATVSFAGAADVSAADAAAGFRYSFALSAGDLVATYAAASTTASAAFPFPTNGSYTVHGRVFDKDGGFTDYTTVVVVSNVAPTATVTQGTNLTVTAGAPVNLTSSTTDPGNNVTDPGKTWEVVSGSGQVVSSGSGTAFAFTPTAGGTYTVLFKVTDTNGAVAVTTVQVTVVDAAPKGVLTNSGPVVEGGTATVTLTPTTASPTALRYAYDFDNDGTFDLGTGTYAGSVAANAATVPASYLADGPFNRVVRVRVIDATGAFTDATTTIPVVNAPPAVAVGGSVLLTESAAALARTGSFTDSGADTWTATVDYGAGAGPQPLALNPDRTFALGHAYADGGNYTVTVRVTDDNGGVGTASVTVSVANVAPTAALGNGGAVTEGSTGAVAITGAADPSPTDTAAGFRYAYDFDNDGTFEVGDGTYAGSVTATSATVPAAFLADNPSRTVRGRVIDKDGGFTDYTTTITVTNVAPTATAVAGPANVVPDEPATFSLAGVTDPSPVDTASLRYRFAASPGGLAADYAHAGGSNPADLTFTVPGSYTVYARVYDKGGGISQTFTLAVLVSQVFVQGGDLYVYGKAGSDTIQVAQSGGGVAVTINGVSFGAYTPTGAIRVFGRDGNDTVAVDSTVALPAVIRGEGGNDTPHGGSGNDTVDGGAGDDVVTAIAGNDALTGGDGNDTPSGGAGNDALDGGAGSDSLDGGSGDDTLVGAAGNDSLTGGSGDDFMDGGAGNDSLDGGAGADVMLGGSGDDIIIGGTTASDTDAAALNQIRAVWNATGTYQSRVAALQSATFAYRLVAGQAVFDDGAVDYLTGSSGQDWFFANVDGATAHDQITDLGGNETNT